VFFFFFFFEGQRFDYTRTDSKLAIA